MNDNVVKKDGVAKAKDTQELRHVYGSLFVCVVVPLVLSLCVGHFSGYYDGLGFLGLEIALPSMLFAVLTPIMFAVLGLGLHFTMIATRATLLDFRLSLSLWMATFLFALSWIVVFFSSHMVVMSFVWMAVTLALSIMLTIINLKMNLASAICSLFFSGYLSFIVYVLIMALAV